jgi:hypothetical protein
VSRRRLPLPARPTRAPPRHSRDPPGPARNAPFWRETRPAFLPCADRSRQARPLAGFFFPHLCHSQSTRRPTGWARASQTPAPRGARGAPGRCVVPSRRQAYLSTGSCPRATEDARAHPAALRGGRRNVGREEKRGPGRGTALGILRVRQVDGLGNTSWGLWRAGDVFEPRPPVWLDLVSARVCLRGDPHHRSACRGIRAPSCIHADVMHSQLRRLCQVRPRNRAIRTPIEIESVQKQHVVVPRGSADHEVHAAAADRRPIVLEDPG